MTENISLLWESDKKDTIDSWHSMCSYLGAFPPTMARFFIENFSKKKDLVFDPFGGRGTTILEARLLGRDSISTDLNPIAVALSKAKNQNINTDEAIRRIEELETRYDQALYTPEAKSQPNDIRLIFHLRTLAELCYLKRKLLNSEHPMDAFILGCTLGILHGGERKNGSSGYASISMPNTFSMSPNYVRKFVQTNQLNRAYRNVFDLIREKIQRLFNNHQPFSCSGNVYQADSKQLSSLAPLQGYKGKVNLVFTSPPYLGVVNYAKQNWIRTWFLNENPNDVSNHLDDDLTLGHWVKFSQKIVEELVPFLHKKGIAIFVIGDVSRSKTSVIPLAREFCMMVKENKFFKHIWVYSDYLAGNGKTTRIWGDTKGNATTIDRIVILANHNPFKRMDLGLKDNPLIYEEIMQSTKRFL